MPRKITDLPDNLRPREKLLTHGAESLTLSELISVVLITGTRMSSITTISKKIGKLLTNSRHLDTDALKAFGLGKSKTAQILAVYELGKRLNSTSPTVITSAREIYAQSQEIINKTKESLLCFYLNARGEILKKEIIAVGHINAANVEPVQIFAAIREIPVQAIILVHNHPSGNLDPSEMDILFSKRIKTAGEIIGVRLLDHIIVGAEGWRRIKF